MRDKYDVYDDYGNKLGRVEVERQPNAAEQLVGGCLLLLLTWWILKGIAALFLLLLQGIVAIIAFPFKQPKLALLLSIVGSLIIGMILGTFLVVRVVQKRIQTNTNEQHYQAATTAFTNGQWEIARTELQQIPSDYKDTHTLLLESYYQPAIAAYSVGQLDVASAELKQLLEIDSTYKDASILLADIYYKLAITAIQAQEWDKASKEIAQLHTVQPSYKDIPNYITSLPQLRKSLVDNGVLGSINVINTLQAPEGGVKSIAVSPNGAILAAGTGQNVYIWQLPGGEQLQVLAVNFEGGVDTAFSFDGSAVASVPEGQIDDSFRVWRVSDGTLLHQITHEGIGNSIDFSPNRNMLALGSNAWATTTSLWNFNDGSLIKEFQGHSSEVSSVEFSPDGNLLATGSWDTNVIVWDVETGMIRYTLQGHTDDVNDVAFSKDGTFLASCSDDGTIRVWQVNNGNLLQTIDMQSIIQTNYTPEINRITFSPDNSMLAIVWWDSIWLLRVKDGVLLKELKIEENNDVDITDTAFSPDGLLLASGLENGRIVLWKLWP